MQKQNKFGAIVFLLALSFFFYAKNAGAQTISENTTWTKETPNLIFNNQISIENGAVLTIEKGAKLIFQINPNSPFNPAGISVISGKLVANGTREEPVIFTSPDDGFNLLFKDDNQISFMRYAEIINGGFIPTAQDGGGDLVPHYPVFEIIGGKVHIENSKFINSRFDEIRVDDGYVYDVDGNFTYDADGNTITKKAQVEIVNSNFSNQEALHSGIYCPTIWDEFDNEVADWDCLKRIYLKNNWYGNQWGPTMDEDTIIKGYHVRGQHYLDAWKTDQTIINPVIVIPGIMGSAKVSNEWKLDPILHTYDDLIESLETNGYTNGKNIFEFPYDWENSNKTSAIELKTKINNIVSDTKISKVDLVAHSMGGLVARQFINDDSNNSIDNLITLGTPHHGSPEAYLKWEAGEGFSTRREKIAKHHFEMEALHSGYTNIFSYIQERIPSVKELLPDYDYLFDVAQNTMRSYSNNYPENTFIEDLNSSASVEKLKDIDFTNIIGVLNNTQNTISGIRVVNSSVLGRWENGMPENFYDSKTDRGLINGDGDATVPEVSGENITSDKIIKINSVHDELPVNAQCEVVKKLMHKINCINVNKIHIPSILLFNVFSPIDIQIIAPDGKKVGKNFETGEIYNEIEGAYYTGFGTENEFITIPNPQDGDYKIITQGTGDGDYKVETTKISEDSGNPQMAVESTGTISGIAEPDKIEEKIVTVAGDAVITEPSTADTEAPAISINIPEENKTYLNNETLNINYSITDNVSTAENIKKEIFLDSVVSESLQIDLALEKLGGHKLKITAEDEAGNKSEKESAFINSANIDSIIANINHYAKLGLLKDKKTKTTLLKEAKKIKNLMSQLEKISEKHWFFRQFVANWKRNINHKIDKLIGKIEGKKGNYDDDEDDDRPDYKNNFIVSQPARDLLVESLESIKY